MCSLGEVGVGQRLQVGVRGELCELESLLETPLHAGLVLTLAPELRRDVTARSVRDVTRACNGVASAAVV